MPSSASTGFSSNNAHVAVDFMGAAGPASVRPSGLRGHSDSDVTPRGVDPSGAHTWSDFLQDGEDSSAGSGSHPSTVERRNTLVAMDRKRRLTTGDDSARRRSVGGTLDGQGLSSSRNEHVKPPSRRPSWRPSDFTGVGPSISGVEGPPSVARHRTNSGIRRGDGSREYVLPNWQPDTEVSKCPICGTQFTFWYRKHHCRKCGRVVCASCSPHRITIPRQFIVHPPDSNKPSPNTTATNSASSNIIDLTGEDDILTETNMSLQAQQRQEDRISAGLGGGEEVRLCNPCVPDPNPDPPRNYSNDHALHGRPVPRWTNGIALDGHLNPTGQRNPMLAEHNGLGPPRGWDLPHHRSHYSMPTNALPPIGRELRRQRGRGMIFQPEGRDLSAVHTRDGEIPEEGLPGYSSSNCTVVPGYRGGPPSYTSSSSSSAVPQWAPPGYNASTAGSSSAPRPDVPVHGIRPFPPPPRRSSAVTGHSRIQSADALMGDHEASYDRVNRQIQAMLDARSSRRSHDGPPAPSRPRLHERDICPICRRALPPRGADGNEEAREAHVMDCISQRDPTSSTPNQQPTQSYMLPFIATEKDCMGEDGSPQECTICMVEYDVGDELARLECLCRFHKTCIVEWFDRKRECPVHKLSGQ